MRAAIIQSNYIPWKGYFDIINSADLFVFHDDLQYTKSDWRNRNTVLGPNGPKWLTIPCGSDENRLICEVALNDSNWQKEHFNLITEYYRPAPYFKSYIPIFEEFYLNHEWKNLSDLNQYLIKKICTEYFQIKTRFGDSRPYELRYRKQERVIELVKKIRATTYISGPKAKQYLSEKVFDAENIKLEWMSYDGYTAYPQLWTSTFHNNVSVIDLIFNVGPEFKPYMLSF